MANYKNGDEVRISDEVENDAYDEFRGQDLVITHVAENYKGHPGYDSSLDGEGLYDLKTKTGKDVPFSLYDYELEDA